jgi:sugar phosphate isomerase/epimerase
MRRRQFLQAAAAAPLLAADAPTRFQLACMTLPYSVTTFERALTGIKSAGFQYVAWGVAHTASDGARKPLIEPKAPAADAAAMAVRCRSLGLEPVMMFATTHFEAPTALDDHLRRIDQAHAAKIPSVLTFGGTKGGGYAAVIRNLKNMAGHAKAAGVTVFIKQHGGETATGEACARILADVAHESVKLCYDAGNVMDYEGTDPIPDIHKCWRDIRGFCIKDHRDTPKDEDCGIGFGEIDHYKLLRPVMRTGLTMPMAFENIFEPLAPRPTAPEAIDRLARRSREYLETVLAGLERT